MAYLPGLVLALAAFWAVLSGRADAPYTVFGAISVFVAVWMLARLNLIDRTASPWHRAPQLLAHLVWLVGEIARANAAVLAAIARPDRGLHPGMTRPPMSARSELGRALFANSITLTPGTVAIDMDDGSVLVHALDRRRAPPESFADMDRRSAAAADPNP